MSAVTKCDRCGRLGPGPDPSMLDPAPPTWARVYLVNRNNKLEAPPLKDICDRCADELEIRLANWMAHVDARGDHAWTDAHPAAMVTMATMPPCEVDGCPNLSTTIIQDLKMGPPYWKTSSPDGPHRYRCDEHDDHTINVRVV